MFDFFRNYVLTGLITLIIALLVVSFASWVAHRRTNFILRSALRSEIETNLQVAKSLVDYAQVQMSSEMTVQPMPKFYDSAFAEYKRAGLLTKLPTTSMEEQMNL